MREYRLLNNNWKFTYGDKAWDSPEEITKWQDIGLPHSFGIPYFMEKEFYVGYGTYSKWFELSKEDCKNRILLKFFGVFQKAVVIVNGKQIGEHRGGYTPFLVELTGNVHPGQNHLIVRVDNLWDAALAPRGGEHQFNGGIYRDVQLILTAYSYIEEDGVSVQTTQLEKKNDNWHAELKIQTQVHASEAERICLSELSRESEKNVSDLKQVDLNGTDSMVLETCICEEKEVLTRALSPLNRKKADHSKSDNKKDDEKQLSQICQSISLTGITPWSPDTPKLYTVVSRVLCNGTELDCVRTSVGIRTVRFDKDEGFFLNGEHFSILGANVHQDHAGWADAVTRSGIRRDIQMIKECGMNTIRGSHYPHHPYFAQVCDEKGILFWSEMCFWGTGGDKQEGYWTASAYPPNESYQVAFEKNCLDQLEEMIHSQRNHPSIICWSMCNEVFFTDEPVKDKAKALIRKMVNRSHELDPSRPAAVGGAQRDGFDVLGDLAGYNGDGAALYHDPGFPNLVSEYGSSIETRPGTFSPRFTDGTEIDYPWRSGKILWCGFHHGSIFDGMGFMGMIDYYRLPLACWYWYREHLTGKKAPEAKQKGTPYQIRLSSDVSEFDANGQEDAWICAELLDKEGNPIANEIELTLTVVKGDGIFPTGKSITFSPENSSMLDGMAAIEFRSWYGGENVIRAEASGVKSAEISILAKGTPLPVNVVLNSMLPAPYVVGEPKRSKRYDEAKTHPVFVSSFKVSHEPYFVTADNDGCWMPETVDKVQGECLEKIDQMAESNEKKDWVMVDLEGVHSIGQAEVVFSEAADETWPETIFAQVCCDQKWEPIELKRKDGRYQSQKMCVMRYFKLDWNKTKRPVKQIHLWAGGENEQPKNNSNNRQ